MPHISVRHEHDAHYHVAIRSHGLVVDQPVGAGGADLGPTPTELFVGSLAACVAFYVGSYLMRHRIPTTSFRVDCDFSMSNEAPSRVTAIRLDLVLPAELPDSRRDVVLRIAERCTVHNSIVHTPAVTIVEKSTERVA